MVEGLFEEGFIVPRLLEALGPIEYTVDAERATSEFYVAKLLTKTEAANIESSPAYFREHWIDFIIENLQPVLRDNSPLVVDREGIFRIEMTLNLNIEAYEVLVVVRIMETEDVVA